MINDKEYSIWCIAFILSVSNFGWLGGITITAGWGLIAYLSEGVKVTVNK